MIITRRTHNQLIEGAHLPTPGEVVHHLGAVQAQDYLASLWAIGLRMGEADEARVEQAVIDRTIVRTWPMRGTLHFVAADDVRWMLRLMTPRVIAQSAGRYRQLELDEEVFAKSRDLLVAALEGGKMLTRSDLFEVLEGAGISTPAQRGIHILSHLAQEGVLCFGSRRDKQPTFTLLDEWLPATRLLGRDEALATIAKRYFTGHGPATAQDFARWTGLTVADAKAGLNDAKAELVEDVIDGETYWRPASEIDIRESTAVHLLPAFDEYLIGYKERGAVLAAEDVLKVIPGKNGMFNPIVVIGGRVAGTWKRTFKKDKVVIDVEPFRDFTSDENEAFTAAAQRYRAFLGMPETV